MEDTNVEAGQDQSPGKGFSDYWQSIVLVGAIFSIVSFALSIFFGYRQINSFWRLQGWWDYLHRKQGWGDMRRRGFRGNADSAGRS